MCNEKVESTIPWLQYKSGWGAWKRALALPLSKAFNANGSNRGRTGPLPGVNVCNGVWSRAFLFKRICAYWVYAQWKERGEKCPARKSSPCTFWTSYDSEKNYNHKQKISNWWQSLSLQTVCPFIIWHKPNKKQASICLSFHFSQQPVDRSASHLDMSSEYLREIFLLVVCYYCQKCPMYSVLSEERETKDCRKVCKFAI